MSLAIAAVSVAIAKDMRTQTDAFGGLLADLRALANDTRESTRSLTAKVSDTLTAVDHSLGQFDRQAEAVTAQTGKVADGAARTMGKLDEVLDRTSDVLARNADGIGDLIASVRDLAQRSTTLIASLQAGKGVVGQLLVNNDLAKDLNEISVNLNLASELISEHPESLVFGTSNKQYIEQRVKRDRIKMRRSFNEGFYTTPPAEEPTPTLLESARQAKSN
jgi:methyl-accepting chemotaxis protein